MESQRSFILIALALVSFLLWQEWLVKDVDRAETIQSAQALPNEPVNAVASAGASLAQTPANTADVPSDISTSTAAPAVAAVDSLSERYISVETDTLSLLIDRVGGDVVKANLIKYPITEGSDDAYSLLRPNPVGLYVAQSGLVGANGPDANPAGRPMYDVTSNEFVLTGDSLRVPLTWTDGQGMTITKTFVLNRDSHTIAVEKTVDNATAGTIVVQPYAQLKQTFNLPDGSMFMPTYRGAAYGTEEKQYEKYHFSDIQDENLRVATPAGWISMIEHYFLSAWVPPQDKTNTIYTRAIGEEFATIGFTSEQVAVAAGQSQTLTNLLYLGPKDQDTLRELATGLHLTVDYGFLWFISEWLFWLLQAIQGVVLNWGVAIIIITIIVKGIMYPLTKKQYESMAKMRALAPKMEQIKQRVGDDRQKMSQAMMDLYKKEKVNPMGGCFPLLLQMPIFLALYWVFLESVELRHADFVLWITDLSVADPYFVLPILTGLSMWALQKLQPMTIQDEMQKKILQAMPILMTVFFAFFPAGLVLYWLISNVITLVQAKMIYASMEKRGLKLN